MRNIYVLHIEIHIFSLVSQHFHPSVRYLREKVWACKSKEILIYAVLLAAIICQNVAV
jgi:hypothetical protein